jgi:integrase
MEKNMHPVHQSVAVFAGLVLYKRARSSYWQCRFKHQHRWLRFSTQCEALELAKIQATKLYHSTATLAEHGLLVQSKRFGEVAGAVVGQLEALIRSGRAKAIHKDYVTCLRKYLVPYFGKQRVDKIDAAMLENFDDWRQQRMARVPTRSTIATHNAALNLVFKQAESKGWLAAGQRPQLTNTGRRGDVRASFSKTEYEVIWRNLRHWVERGRSGKSQMMRELLRDYVLVLANTGIRHGTEAMNLRWCDIDWYEQDGERYLRMTVSGKVSKMTGARSLIARHATADYLRRIQSRFPHLARMSFDELLRARVDEPVFRLSDGTRTDGLAQTFKAFLREYGLLYSSTSPLKRTLYSLRHMYATLALQDGLDVHKLARQMGTSVTMIERHYSKFSSEMNAKQFAGG